MKGYDINIAEVRPNGNGWMPGGQQERASHGALSSEMFIFCGKKEKLRYKLTDILASGLIALLRVTTWALPVSRPSWAGGSHA
jgi:hypothetical protein